MSGAVRTRPGTKARLKRQEKPLRPGFLCNLTSKTNGTGAPNCRSCTDVMSGLQERLSSYRQVVPDRWRNRHGSARTSSPFYRAAWLHAVGILRSQFHPLLARGTSPACARNANGIRSSLSGLRLAQCSQCRCSQCRSGTILDGFLRVVHCRSVCPDPKLFLSAISLMDGRDLSQFDR